MDGTSSPSWVAVGPTPQEHLIDGRLDVPSVERSPKRRCRCLCHLLVALVSALLGSASTTAYFIMHSLLDGPPTNSSAAPHTCPGLCVGRTLHGNFATNVSATKHVGPITVVVRFHVAHTFDWEARLSTLRVVPIDFEPHWLPNVLHPIRCDAVPFDLGAGCNVTVEDACTRQAFARNDIERLDLLWDPGLDALAASETVNTGFFTQTFVWSEDRVS